MVAYSFLDALRSLSWNNIQTMIKNFNPTEAYNLLMKIPYTPILLYIQTTWCCFSLRFSRRTKNYGFFNSVFMVILSFILTFGSRSVVAYLLHRPFPFLENRDQLTPFFIVAGLMFFLKFDIVYRLSFVVYLFLIPIQCFNQIKLLTICTRHRFPLPLTIVLVNMEVIIMVLLSLVRYTQRLFYASEFTLILNSALIYAQSYYLFKRYSNAKKTLMMLAIMGLTSYFAAVIDLFKSMKELSTDYDQILKQQQELLQQQKELLKQKKATPKVTEEPIQYE
ncbi:hypothetical protein TVAG_055580 [Trichomonas vaginalis G3]|uniref:Transmembrane protein n=1 Tax=Trichomonas vaginalis (strain ATCC PRA-98 / G3) TaxID=412133 RepID=A2EY01_TRIV3|nr:hypothetical protein TVAGG3_0730460 [Trichomonas vaginalis G3]EAY02469.1 hypothetical protein TVAG_055580 [Trichomonas vaginalis G3]KAI5511214.1 hypothetical protein TVAGG3_0730460 [Trichomonas vaginalis G3]|eukprot:XP_001314708.1 hypothetical protein [Trichomonas vaginalis G3]